MREIMNEQNIFFVYKSETHGTVFFGKMNPFDSWFVWIVVFLIDIPSPIIDGVFRKVESTLI